MKLTTFDEFVDLAKRGTFVPVCKEIIADLLTPVSAFLKIAEHSDYAFLLESVEGGEHVGRYSFLGKDPFLVAARARRQDGHRARRDDGGGGRGLHSDAAEADGRLPRRRTCRICRASPAARSAISATMPRSGSSRCRRRAGRWKARRRDRPGRRFMLFDTVLAFDHVAAPAAPHRQRAHHRRRRPRGALSVRLRAASSSSRPSSSGACRAASRRPAAPSTLRSNLTQEQFETDVRTAKEHIAAGDIYQVVLSQRFEADVTADPFTVYRALRHVNPSPYMYFLRLGKLADRRRRRPRCSCVSRGAAPRRIRLPARALAARTTDEDQRLAEELKRNEKERAEHVMLVDLGRNDLGRVCDYGSVRVPQFMTLERYSHVMHLVSIVEGQLADDTDRLDALASCFPAGTVSGAPKVRAMEIIADLEPTRRGVYAGAVGYLDFAGNLDFCIAIRTVVMANGKAYIQAGAGIVADSNPDGGVRGDQGQGQGGGASPGAGAGGAVRCEIADCRRLCGRGRPRA